MPGMAAPRSPPPKPPMLQQPDEKAVYAADPILLDRWWHKSKFFVLNKAGYDTINIVLSIVYYTYWYWYRIERGSGKLTLLKYMHAR